MLNYVLRCENANAMHLLKATPCRHRSETVGLGKVPAKMQPRTGQPVWQACMALGFTVFFCPASYAVPSSLYTAWRVAVVAVAGISVLLVLIRNRMRLRWAAVLLGALSYYFVSAVFGSGSVSFINALYNASRLIGIASLLEYGLEKDCRRTIFCFLIAGVVMCCVNFAVFLEYHDVKGGMQNGYIRNGIAYQGGQNWFFFSHDNGTLFYYLPVMACFWYYGFTYSRKALIFAFAFSVATVAMFVFLWSATAMVVAGAFLIAMIACLKGNIRRFLAGFSYHAALALGLGFCVIVVFLNVTGAFDSIASIFGKSLSAGTRAEIWSSSVDWFLRSPIVGVGYEDDAVSVLRIGINHCHNVIVQLPYTGGLVTVLFFTIFIGACKPKGRVPASAAPLLAYVPLIFVAWTFDFYLYMTITAVPFLLLARCCDAESQNESAGPVGNKLADKQ